MSAGPLRKASEFTATMFCGLSAINPDCEAFLVIFCVTSFLFLLTFARLYCSRRLVLVTSSFISDTFMMRVCIQVGDHKSEE